MPMVLITLHERECMALWLEKVKTHLLTDHLSDPDFSFLYGAALQSIQGKERI